MSKKTFFLTSCVILLILCAGIIAETILEQPTIPGTSLQIDDLSNVYAIVDDNTVVPAETNKVALKTIRDLDTYSITTAAPTALTGDEPNRIYVNVTNASHIVTVPSGMSCTIYNVSATNVTLEVDVITAANQFVFPGDYLVIWWDGSQHVPRKSYVSPIIAGSVTTIPPATDVIKAYVDGLAVTLDTSISTGSTNGITNGAITTYVQNRDYVQPGDEVVTGTGNPATDNANVATAVTNLNNQGYGTLWIRGEVALTGGHLFTKPISLRGLGRNAALNITNATSYVTWTIAGKGSGSLSWSPLNDGSSVAFAGAARGDSVITSANLALTPGEFVLLHSSDLITEVDPHNPFIGQYPWEIHEVIDTARGSNQYDLGTPVIDTLTTTPLIIKIPILDGPEKDNVSDVLVSDFIVRQYSDTGSGAVFYLQNLNGVRVENLIWDTTSGVSAPGMLQFDMCMNVLVNNIIERGQENYNENAKSQYFLEFLTCLNVKVSNCIFQKSRHCVDTSADDDGTYRYGGCVNLVVDNCTFQRAGNSSSGVSNSAPMSTHPEGWGVVVQNCVFYLGDESPNINQQHAILFRSRHNKVLNCTFEGPNMDDTGDSNAIGVYMNGWDQEVAYCTFNNLWNSVRINNITPGPSAQHHIHHNLMTGATNAGGAQIYIYEGDDVRIQNNVFEDNANGAIHTIAGVAVDNVIVSGNEFIETPNTKSGTEPTIELNGTGASNATNWTIARNSFIQCEAECVNDLGTGAGHKFIGNMVIDSGGTDIIQIAGTTGSTWLIRSNDVSDNALNTNFFDIGAAAVADITISGNTVMGYGVNSLGLVDSGSGNAATINTAQNGDNWTD